MLKTWAIKTYTEIMCAVNKMLKDEEGDTNFISILIILGIVILLAGVFMVFKDRIVEQVQEIVGDFTID